MSPENVLAATNLLPKMENLCVCLTHLRLDVKECSRWILNFVLKTRNVTEIFRSGLRFVSNHRPGEVLVRRIVRENTVVMMVVEEAVGHVTQEILVVAERVFQVVRRIVRKKTVVMMAVEEAVERVLREVATMEFV